MKKCDEKEKKEVLLEILIYFDELCKKYGLKYTLYGGTLLGAARHRGFIPWDDDVDVMMPLPDYFKFMNIPEVTNLSKRYVLHCSEMENKNNEKYVYPFLKLEDSKTEVHFSNVLDTGGAFIDIFPLTSYPNTSKKVDILSKKVMKLTNRILCSTFKAPKGDLLRSIKYKVCRLRYKIYRKKMMLLIFGLGYENSEEVSQSMWALSKKNIEEEHFPRKWMFEYEKLAFEGHEFNVISKYEQLLQLKYGDWKKLPPKNKQIFSHSYTLLKKE